MFTEAIKPAARAIASSSPLMSRMISPELVKSRLPTRQPKITREPIKNASPQAATATSDKVRSVAQKHSFSPVKPTPLSLSSPLKNKTAVPSLSSAEKQMLSKEFSLKPEDLSSLSSEEQSKLLNELSEKAAQEEKIIEDVSDMQKELASLKPSEKDPKLLATPDDTFNSFFDLLKRIINQREQDAQGLYKKIKARTDDIDSLTLLSSKINSTNGPIDWSNDEQMKQLVNHARSLGVTIEEGKYSWTEEEKKALKENIYARKDSMQHLTQLERTDMQRMLQDVHDGHIMRSNILKKLSEAMSVIIGNIRK